MNYVLVAYSIVLIVAFGFGLWEWYSLRCLEKRCPSGGSKYETQT